MKESLTSSEWTLLAALAFIMASLVFLAKVNAHRAADLGCDSQANQIQILVTIDGAVKKAGSFWVEEGVSVKEALRKAKPSPWADLKSVPLEQLIVQETHVHVPVLKEVRVHVSGAIAEMVDLVLPAGSRISDLKSKIGFTPETDRSFFRRRKLLRDGEKIEVPKKPLE
ncbi:MAG: SLBB domain-containing protein [Verrucomicrobia bacterium]|nr:SLBB domain-containing protein [Verrucomicrobiota bacterium]MBU6446175.1 SLBB domain-containing protein [Verrucomicrobiota bacterium]MDE3046748.1 SLBB domain-containing protein [Verrucomicrobiota bacterium]